MKRVKPYSVTAAASPPMESEQEPMDRMEKASHPARLSPTSVQSESEDVSEIKERLAKLETKIQGQQELCSEIETQISKNNSTVKPLLDSLEVTKLKLQRLERVSQMSEEEWKDNLSIARRTLNTNSGASPAEHQDAQIWLEVLSHYYPTWVDVNPEAVAMMSAILILADEQLKRQDAAQVAHDPMAKLLLEEQQARLTLEQEEYVEFSESLRPLEEQRDKEMRQKNEKYRSTLAEQKKFLETRIEEEKSKSNLSESLQVYSELHQELARLRLEKSKAESDLLVKRREEVTVAYDTRVELLRETCQNLRKIAEISARTLQENENYQALKRKFKKQVLEFQMFELKCTIECGGENPYLDNAEDGWRSRIKSYLSGGFYDNPLFKPTRPTVDDLVLEYQLALHGKTGIRDAYEEMFKTLRVPNFTSAWNSISLENVRKVLEYPAKFALAHPTYAARLAADIAQTAAILGVNDSDPNFGPILKRRTAQNQVTDRVLGRYRALQGVDAQENLPEISLEELAMLDFARKAPYIAGVINQSALLGGQAAQSAAAWIPGIGAWRPVQLAAGAAGAVAQVRAQQKFSDQISREMEVTANAVLNGFEGYAQGGLSGAVQQAALYVAQRKAATQLGDWMRGGIEGKSVSQRLANFTFPDRYTHQGAEFGKSAVALTAGTAIGIGSTAAAIASAGGVVAASTFLWPVALAAATAVGVKKLVDVVADTRKSESEVTADKAVEDARRLIEAYKRLRQQRDELPELSDEQLTKAGESGLPKLIEEQADKNMANVIPQVAAQAGLDMAQAAELLVSMGAKKPLPAPSSSSATAAASGGHF